MSTNAIRWAFVVVMALWSVTLGTCATLPHVGSAFVLLSFYAGMVSLFLAVVKVH